MSWTKNTTEYPSWQEALESKYKEKKCVILEQIKVPQIMESLNKMTGGVRADTISTAPPPAAL